MCEYMPTDKQYDGQLIDEYFRLERIREKAVQENSIETLKEIDKEIACIKIKLKPLTLSEIEKMRDEGTLDQVIMPVDTVFMDLPALVVTGEVEKKILNGNLLYKNECVKAGFPEDFIEGRKVRVYREKENSCNFIAVYQYQPEKKGMIPDKMFLS